MILKQSPTSPRPFPPPFAPPPWSHLASAREQERERLAKLEAALATREEGHQRKLAQESQRLRWTNASLNALKRVLTTEVGDERAKELWAEAQKCVTAFGAAPPADQPPAAAEGAQPAPTS